MYWSEGIQQIDSCIVYHSGENFVVEVDIVLDPETKLSVAHDMYVPNLSSGLLSSSADPNVSRSPSQLASSAR